MDTNTGLLTFEDWSIGPRLVQATPVVPLVTGPSEDFEAVIRELSRSYEIELEPWLKAGEDTFRRIDDLFS